jgi:hypothetical protein
VENTLDGKPSTVWNSDGDRLSSNIGVTLTYRFPAAVKLAQVTIANGSGRSSANYAENQRIAVMRVRTDTYDTTWNLQDSGQAQSLTLPPTTTAAVTFEVTKVYEGTKYRDLVVTDVAFQYVP